MIKHAYQEWQQLWQDPGLWLAPSAIGLLFLGLSGMMFSSLHEGREAVLVFLPILWTFVVLSAVGQGLPLFQEESCFLFYSTTPHAMVWIYRIQCLLLSSLLWLGLGMVALISLFLFDFPVSMLMIQLFILATLLPSLIMLGHVIKSMLPNNPSGAVLLSFILFPLYIPLLLLSALALQAVWFQEPFMPYGALLMAIQLFLWACVPRLLIFSIQLRL